MDEVPISISFYFSLKMVDSMLRWLAQLLVRLFDPINYKKSTTNICLLGVLFNLFRLYNRNS